MYISRHVVLLGVVDQEVSSYNQHAAVHIGVLKLYHIPVKHRVRWSVVIFSLCVEAYIPEPALLGLKVFAVHRHKLEVENLNHELIVPIGGVVCVRVV